MIWEIQKNYANLNYFNLNAKPIWNSIYFLTFDFKLKFKTFGENEYFTNEYKSWKTFFFQLIFCE